jgi:competence protein ComEA
MPRVENFEFEHAFGEPGAAEDFPVAPAAEPPKGSRPEPQSGRGVERVRHWVGDRLPDTLKGRWRMEHRVGTALSAVAVVSGITMGAYALWTAQPQEQSQPFTVARAADRSAEPGAAHADGSGADADSGKGGGGWDRDGPRQESSDQGYLAQGGSGLGGSGPGGSSSQGGPGSAGGAAPSPDQSPSFGIMVDVEGKVTRPGVQRLPSGARVLDAILMAGGALPGTDLSGLDQARVLNDGEQIMVGPGAGAGAGTGQQPGAGQSGPVAKGRGKGQGKAAPDGPVHLNSATLEQLEELPGVGPAMAQRVLDWRNQHGSFSEVGELQQVKGFGAHKFAAVRSLVAL